MADSLEAFSVSNLHQYDITLVFISISSGKRPSSPYIINLACFASSEVLICRISNEFFQLHNYH